MPKVVGPAIIDTPNNRVTASVAESIVVTATAPAATTFLTLTDTPSVYTGFGDYMVAVNAGETALTFVANTASIDGGTFGDAYINTANIDAGTF